MTTELLASIADTLGAVVVVAAFAMPNATMNVRAAV